VLGERYRGERIVEILFSFNSARRSMEKSRLADGGNVKVRE
jgi:hypothetical protein